MASTSDGTPFIETDRTALNGKCANCGGQTRPQDRIRCTLCHRFTHKDCLRTDYKFTENIIKQLAKPTVFGQPFAFVCAICIPKVAIKDTPIIEKLHDTSRRGSRVKSDAAIQEMKSKLDDATIRIQEKEIEIQNQQRRIQLYSENATVGDISSAISKLDDQLAESNATIASLITEKMQLLKSNEEHVKLIDELRQADVSEPTPGQTAKRPRQHSEDLQGSVNNETLLATMKYMIIPIALSVKKIEEKQISFENNQDATAGGNELIKIIQQELSPFNQVLNQLSNNQDKLQQAIQNIKVNVTPRPTTTPQGIDLQYQLPRVNYDTSSRQRPAVAPLPLTYAQAASKSPIPPDAIRNVTLNGSIDQMELTANKIK